jgi:sigma-E factor negative regulatory protein RseB
MRTLTRSAQCCAMFVLAVLAIGLASGASAQLPSSHGDVSGLDAGETTAWLLRIHEAAEARNYQGTLVVSGAGAMASSRISHYADGRQHIERIDAMDGVARHVVRQNDLVHTVWPEQRVVVVEQRDQTSSFPGLLHGGGDAVSAHYELKLGGTERVVGRDAQVLSLQPRDAQRYGYRLWADKATSLLLRMDVLGERGDVLESSAFSQLSVGQRVLPETLLQPIRKLDGFRVTQTDVQRVNLQQEGWRLMPPAPGFVGLGCIKRALDGPLRAAPTQPVQLLQAVYSDGLTYVTVFIEPYQAERHPRAMHTAIGATQTLMRRQGAWWVTLMGDVPAPTLRAFADALVRIP